MFVQSPKESHQVSFGSGFEKKVLLKKISEMEDLPSLDVSIAKIIKLLGDENVDMDELAEAIKRDQALVAKILKLINSSYYSLRKTVDSVERAVVLLGMLKLKQIIYSTSIMDFFSDKDIIEWNHAYTSSFLMTNLMQGKKIPAASNLPLSMLMHDIGKVVLRRFSAKKFDTAVARALEDDIPLYQAEEIVIGIDHADVGGMLLEKWGMPAETFTTVRQHHMNETPLKHIVETALIIIINWVDCTARYIKCIPPAQKLMNIAGLGKKESELLIQKQREFIEKTEKKTR